MRFHATSSEGSSEPQFRGNPSNAEVLAITLNFQFRSWTDWNCAEDTGRFAFSGDMTLKDAMDLAVEMKFCTDSWSKKYAFLPPADSYKFDFCIFGHTFDFEKSMSLSSGSYKYSPHVKKRTKTDIKTDTKTGQEKSLIPLPDTLTLLKHLIKNETTLFISNENHPKKLEAKETRDLVGVARVLGILFLVGLFSLLSTKLYDSATSPT